MSIFNEAVKLINQYSINIYINKCKNIEFIKDAENYLNIKLPDSYKNFLEIYGFLSFGGQEIYGLIDNDFINSEVLDAFWLTMDFRKEFDLPHHIILISDIGDGSYYALDLTQMNDEQECPVVIWPVGGYDETPELEIVAPDFGTWFYDQVMEQIKRHQKPS